MLSATRYRAAAEIARQGKLAQQISKLQQSISSEKRLSKPSDDPSAARRISEIRQSQADLAIFDKNISIGTSISATTDTRLTEIAELLNRAKELVLSGRNDSTSPTDRQTIAVSLRALASDLDNAAASTDPSGNPLFPTGEPIEIPVSDTLSLPATLSRSAVFDGVATAAGPQSLQQILNDAADAVVNVDAGVRADDVSAAITALDVAIGHIIGARTDQGVQANRFDEARNTHDARILNFKEERSMLEDTDLTVALSEFQARDVSLKAAQAVFAQSMRSTLFDLLG